jgi:hypothetical protein
MTAVFGADLILPLLATLVFEKSILKPRKICSA